MGVIGGMPGIDGPPAGTSQEGYIGPIPPSLRFLRFDSFISSPVL